jgi:ubiquinone/menaquinone biosynthesis C-methylase UbiE
MQTDTTLIETILACPRCGGDMRCGSETVKCAKCGTDYPVRDGIPVFAVFGSVNGVVAAPDETSEQYQQCYQEVSNAAAYNAMYRDSWAKRITTRREFRLLSELLATQGHSKVVLDLPCGGGRVSPPLAPHTDLLIEADIALGQVRYGRDKGRVATKQTWMTASGFHIPLKDSSVDGAVCIRLNHHLPLPAEREKLVRELLRVARRFVIMTFLDFHSIKNSLRRMRRPFDRKPPKCTMKVSEVRELARSCGAEMAACPALFPVGSGHRYALLVKRPA